MKCKLRKLEWKRNCPANLGQVAELRTNFESGMETISRVKTDVEALSQGLNEVQTSQARMETKLSGQAAELGTKFESGMETIRRVKTDVEALSQRLNEVQTSLAELGTKLESDIKTLETGVKSDMQASQAQTETCIFKLGSDIETKFKVLVTEFTSFRSNVANMGAKLDSEKVSEVNSETKAMYVTIFLLRKCPLISCC